MAKQVLQRLSFTAGELTPWLAGRADLDPVSRGASRLINFLVSPFGGGNCCCKICQPTKKPRIQQHDILYLILLVRHKYSNLPNEL